MRIEDLPPKYQKQAQEKIGRRSAKNAPRRSKYNNTKAVCGALKFDSKKERERFLQLMQLQNEGRITNLHLQQTFTLREAYTLPSGERVRGTTYKADFTYYDADGKLIIEDVKGVRTDVYKLKRKMMIDKGYEIREV